VNGSLRSPHTYIQTSSPSPLLALLSPLALAIVRSFLSARIESRSLSLPSSSSQRTHIPSSSVSATFSNIGFVDPYSFLGKRYLEHFALQKSSFTAFRSQPLALLHWMASSIHPDWKSVTVRPIPHSSSELPENLC
jgi:hypothetical protein